MLEDYSGAFDPNISFDKLAKDTLVSLTKMYAKLYSAIDGFWYLSVKERINDDEALACDIWVWEKEIKYELGKLTKLLKIQGRDVITLIKALQVSPWFWVLKYKLGVENKNHVILTITDCPTLTALENEGTGREEKICKTVEPLIFKKYAEYFNPNIEVRHLMLPPRKNKDGICCQWDFNLKSEVK
ncbi:MAG: hypothetical protein JW732_00950 [Dehalococcoidia bacterium]|nr:hypothetical protein [Dehalococcoidia bacterium]